MSETQKHNPNKQPNYTARRWMVAAGAGTLLLGAAAGGNAVMSHVSEGNKLENQLTSGHAFEDYKRGEIKKDDVVVIEVKHAGNGNPDSVAIRIDSKKAEDEHKMKTLSGEIAAQADAQGYPGVEAGEVLVLDKDLVDPKIAEDWAVQQPAEQGPGDVRQAP